MVKHRKQYYIKLEDIENGFNFVDGHYIDDKLFVPWKDVVANLRKINKLTFEDICESREQSDWLSLSDLDKEISEEYDLDSIICSNCKKKSTAKTKFCPNCGNRMKL